MTDDTESRWEPLRPVRSVQEQIEALIGKKPKVKPAYLTGEALRQFRRQGNIPMLVKDDE